MNVRNTSDIPAPLYALLRYTRVRSYRVYVQRQVQKIPTKFPIFKFTIHLWNHLNQYNLFKNQCNPY